MTTNNNNEIGPTTTFFAGVWIVVGVFVFITGWGVYQAWIVERIWAWYMVAKFHAPAITLGESYIAVMLIRFILPGTDTDPNSSKWKDGFWSGIAAKAIMWAMLLGIAWWLR